MAGHNKWSQIKRKKAANDGQRSKIISKHIRAIVSAVREGGSSDPSNNVSLKNALAAAKSDNVSSDNVKRAIERASGGAEGNQFDSVVYEGYGPAGVAVIVEALTDNRNRTVASVRHVFSKHGGNMSGSTAWQFETKGMIVIPSSSDDLLEFAMDLDVEDIEQDDDTITLYTEPGQLFNVVEALEAKGYKSEMSQLTKVAQTETALSAKDADKVMRFMESLEDLDDVQNVYSTANFDALEIA